jgi:excinuclease ABC subunit C
MYMRGTRPVTTDTQLAKKLENLPVSPGVYLMKNRAGKVIYVGKALELRKRVGSYFADVPKDPKTTLLVKEIVDIDVIVTDTEVEALLTENTLIKEYRPKFNVTLKDDKNFLSIRIDLRDEFPRFTLVRSIKRDGALYFGPYTDAGTVRQNYKWLSATFGLRQCSDHKFANRSRPCIYYQIGQSSAPCVGYISRDDYHKSVDQAVMFLKGRDEALIGDLTNRMTALSDEMRFEEAAVLRDRIAAVTKMVAVQKVVTSDDIDRDVVGLVREGTSLGISVLFVRAGRLMGSRYQLLTNVLDEDPVVVQDFIEQYYHSKEYIPPEILLPVDIPQAGLVGQWLSREAPVRLHVPKRGVLKDLVGMAARNAESSFQAYKKTRESREQSLQSLAKRLGLAASPRRMECFDISNISGTNAVGSMAVFVDGEAQTKEYRRFRVKGVTGIDDYAMMDEVFRRRMKSLSPENRPDLILIDGGKGHLAIAYAVLKDLGITNIPLFAIAKEKENKADPDRVYPVGRKNPFIIKGNSSALFLLMRLRDEAHRLAVEYHKKLRQKRGVASALDEIPGIGAKKKRALLAYFPRISDIKGADIHELTRVSGITEALARAIREYFDTRANK